MTVAPQRDQPGRSPQGPAAPVKPLPSGPPHPALQAVGFNGSIHDFNDRLAAVAQAHTAATGTRPTPGVAIDIVRSPIPVENFAPLFTGPRTQTQARVQTDLALHAQQNPVISRPDGTTVTHTPLSQQLYNHRDAAPGVGELSQKYPWVPAESGFLPVKNFAALLGAFDTLTKTKAGTAGRDLTVGGQTLGQYEKQVQVGNTPGNPLVGSLIAQGKFEGPQNAVKTVKAAQDELRKDYPAYFAHLTPDGDFNQDWIRATASFQSSATYYREATKRLAADNHFDNTADFVNAWKLKQHLLSPEENKVTPGSMYSLPIGSPHFFYAHLPLAFFGNGKSVLDYYTGDQHGWGFLNLPTVGLHAIVGQAKLLFNVASGFSATEKSNAASASTFYKHVLPSYLAGNGEGLKEAQDAAHAQLANNPTWLRIFYPDLAAHPHGALFAADEITNLVGDVILGNKLVLGGSAVKVGDVAGLESDRYYKGATQLAFNSMKRRGVGGVGEASKLLQGGETLNVAVADKIRSGGMTVGEYRQHVADLYHHGQTEVDGTMFHAAETPNATVLGSLRTKNLPNPNLKRQQVKAALDEFDGALRNSGTLGTTRAADMFSSVRQLVGRAAPKSESRRIFDPKTPDDVFNWTVKNFKDRDLAYKVRNDFVVARAKQDIPAIQELNRGLLERYAAEHPNVKGVRTPLEDSTGPQVEAESLSNVKFLAGREKDPSEVAFGNLRAKAKGTNDRLLGLAAQHRQIILSGAPLPGGESLFYKHAVADTLRRYTGGAGLSFRLDEGQKLARSDVRGFFRENPEALRDYSANRASAEIGEVAWITRNRPEQYLSFNTGDHLGDAKRLEGAGAYLRHLVTDDALNAYRASTAADKTPLFKHVWHSSFYQNLIAKNEDFLRDAGQIKQHVKDPAQLRQQLSDLKKSYAHDWVDALWARYQAVNDAGTKAGMIDPLEGAAQVARENPGAKIDVALGKWIKDNKVALEVREAPVKGSQFDGLMQAWIGKLLTFNKLNRKTFFDHIFYDTYTELKTAGWEKADAVSAATNLARAQTVYHMLDFANMLQVEQNLRWLSYYATKHRLYWTWIGRQFVRKPLLAAAVSDISDHLDDRGNLPVELFGHRLVIPAARLVWANNTEYPETSPIFEAGFRTGKNVLSGENLGSAVGDAFASQTSTSGNVLTRQDQAIANLAKSIGVMSGKAPATYGLAVAGMSDAQRASFNKQMHGFILAYRADHDGQYPSEADAVRGTLLRATALEVWRTNLFLPILPDTSQPTEIQALHKQFDQITNPKKRRDFLDKHPELQDSFGATNDQALYLHEQPLWQKFNELNAGREQALESLRQKIDQAGYTPETANELKAISQAYSKEIQRLRRLDALTWKGSATYPAGKLSDNGEIQTAGPWSKQLDGDPLAAKAFLHEAFPSIGGDQLDAHTVGQTVVDLQNEAARIKSLGWKKLGYPDEQTARQRLGQINQKIETFRSFPKTAPQQMIDTYYRTFMDPYRKERQAWVDKLSATPSADRDKVFSAFRAWKEEHDLPVTVTDPKSGKKVTFPSPAAWGLAQLPPAEYHKALAVAATSAWENISGYEKQLLGVDTKPDVAHGWALYQKTITDWRQDPANAGSSLVQFQKNAIAKQVDKYHPGFYKDYLFSQQPKITRYEATNLYTGLSPEVKGKFDKVIGSAAKAFAQAIKQNGNKSFYLARWRDVIRNTVLPWLDEPAQKGLKAELLNYGEQGRAWQDFLNTLPTG